MAGPGAVSVGYGGLHGSETGDGRATLIPVGCGGVTSDYLLPTRFVRGPLVFIPFGRRHLA